jgi:hypothetical protein
MGRDGTHRCPRPGCTQRVPDHLFACRTDWFTLSRGTRQAIWATYRSTGTTPTKARLDAIEAAMEDWKEPSDATT